MAVNLRNIPPSDGDGPAHDARLYLREDELDRAVALLFRASRRFYEAASAPLAAHGLGDAHYRALAAIRRQEGLSVGALQTHLGVVKQSLARVLKELETAGLIARAPSSQDRRSRRLTLTEAGRDAERAVTAALRDKMAVVFRAAGSDAVMGARRILAALADETEGR